MWLNPSLQQNLQSSGPTNVELNSVYRGTGLVSSHYKGGHSLTCPTIEESVAELTTILKGIS